MNNTIFPDYCFFIIDDYFNMETAPEEEIPVYFYPLGYDPIKIALFLGEIQFLIHYVASFIKDDIKIISSNNKKLAIQKNKQFTMVLLGKSDDENLVLQTQLLELCNTYYFYNNDINFTASLFKDKSRKEFLNFVLHQCNSLLPILNNISDNGLKNINLHVLPLTPLLPSKSRCLVQASNILSTISNDSDNNNNGCIFYDDTVLCTYLDVETTRIIRTKCMQIKTEIKNKLNQICKINGHVSLTDDMIFTPIFVNSKQNNYESKSRNLILCILLKMHLTLAFIINFDKIHDKHYINTLIFKIDDKMNKLEQDIHSSMSIISDDDLTNQENLFIISATNHISQEHVIQLNNNKTFIKNINFMDELRSINKSTKIILAGHRTILYANYQFSRRKYYQCKVNNAKDSNIQNLEKHIETLKN